MTESLLTLKHQQNWKKTRRINFELNKMKIFFVIRVSLDLLLILHLSNQFRYQILEICGETCQE
jgi:hypothetical protein